jgi:hypothetical protein
VHRTEMYETHMADLSHCAVEVQVILSDVIR